jgi:hypothetical protein
METRRMGADTINAVAKASRNRCTTNCSDTRHPLLETVE